MIRSFDIGKPASHVRLEFADGTQAQIDEIRGSLSGVVRIGGSLWFAGDETKSVERLTGVDFPHFANHKRFALRHFFNLGDEKPGEIDLEGLAYDDKAKRLWLVGSHSRKWPKPKEAASGDDVFAVLGKIERPSNRFLLGSIAVNDTGGIDGHTPELIEGSGRALPFGETQSGLIDVLSKDSPLAPYLMLPSKDNGFDIEGLACSAGMIFVGLRGPVLNGWASILQLRPIDDGHAALMVASIAGGPRPYHHHLLKLDGLGVRDLCVDGGDLLILAGPTMALDGPFRVFRWRGGARADKDRRMERAALDPLFEIPSGYGDDHAEGMTLFKGADGVARLLVVYDSPTASRQVRGEYRSDLFDIPPAR